MKRKEIMELKNKPLAEMEKFLKDSREKLRVLKFDLAAGKVKNVKDIHAVKKDIARTLTFIKNNKEK